MRALLVGLLTVALLLPVILATPAAEAANCEFTLGFKALRDLIPNVVGECRVNEHHNAINGDGLQETTGVDGKGGLLVWRKADNWTAYTDGYRTWIAGPAGLQQRLNTERFPWEQTTPPPPVPQPGGIQWSQHEDGEKSFKYPSDWRPTTGLSGGMSHNRYYSPDGQAYIYYMAPFKTGFGYKPEDMLIWQMKAWDGRMDMIWGRQERTTIGGHPAYLQWFEFPNADRSRYIRGVSAAIQFGDETHIIDGRAFGGWWDKYEPTLLEVIRSYTAK